MSLQRIGRWLAPALLALASVVAVISTLTAGDVRPDADLMDSLLPPGFVAGGTWAHPLGTDDQGRDLLATLVDAARLSLTVAALAVVVALTVGLALGMLSGARGGLADILAMRTADVQLSFPALLVALLADAALRIGGVGGQGAALSVLVATLGLSIGLGRWPPIARLARTATRREARRDYVAAARLAGRSLPGILVQHIAPNILGPVLALVALDVGFAVMDEATLSFLGLGFPGDRPSLGTMIRDGQDVLLSGAWWPVVVPGTLLVLLVLTAVRAADQLRAEIVGVGP